MSLTQAEHLLQELGITEPHEIDLEAIAYHVNVRVRFRSLHGCEARIVGYGGNAIITVNANGTNRRKRFSIAHELGHWHHHRGKCLVCRVDEYHPSESLAPERVANAYAADLLMPNYIFQPLMRQQGKLSFKMVAALADIFTTSKTATAFRLVQNDCAPAILVCHGHRGRRWFVRAPSVPEKWFPRNELDAESFALGVLFGNKPDDLTPRKIGADAWFDRQEAGRFDVYEQTMRTGPDEILTLILINDRQMMEDDDTRSFSRSGR
ncbi:MAG TPA: ImmA/IrrE family metallo-endopeptidase [Aestuariivirga sp.]|nr:ImmA/IrrE family metallo-endopeptidase [Aestuariivirga sp.]